MRNHRCRLLSIRHAIPLLLVLASTDALAQVVVDFSPVQSIPIPLWAIGVLSLLLAILGWRALRTRLPAHIHRLHGWPLVALISAAILSIYISSGRTARAIVTVTSINLVFPSPVTEFIPLNADVPAVNATGQTIMLNSVSSQSAFFYLVIPSSQPQCLSRLALAPGAVCYVKLTGSTG